MEERVVELYRAHGPEIFARCRRLLGEDAAAAAATPRVFILAQRQLGDAAAVEAAAREVCSRQRRLLLVPTEKEPTPAELAEAKELFQGDVFDHTLALVLRDQSPPPILRWVFFYIPPIVILAGAGMFLAAKNPRNPERFGGGTMDAALEVYRDRGGVTTRLVTERDVHVRPGDRITLVINPAGFRYATVHANARVLARQGPLARNQGRITLPSFVVEDEGKLRLDAAFGPSPRGMPAVERAIELEIDQP